MYRTSAIVLLLTFALDRCCPSPFVSFYRVLGEAKPDNAPGSLVLRVEARRVWTAVCSCSAGDHHLPDPHLACIQIPGDLRLSIGSKHASARSKAVPGHVDAYLE